LSVGSAIQLFKSDLLHPQRFLEEDIGEVVTGDGDDESVWARRQGAWQPRGPERWPRFTPGTRGRTGNPLRAEPAGSVIDRRRHRIFQF